MIEYHQDKTLTAAVFGQGSVCMTQFKSVDRMWLLMEPCPPGLLGREIETLRHTPHDWNKQGVTFADMPVDGQPRMILQFNSREGLDQLILALKDLRAAFDRTAIAM